MTLPAADWTMAVIVSASSFLFSVRAWTLAISAWICALSSMMSMLRVWRIDSERLAAQALLVSTFLNCSVVISAIAALNAASREMLMATATPNTMITPAKASIRRAPTELLKFIINLHLSSVYKSAPTPPRVDYSIPAAARRPPSDALRLKIPKLPPRDDPFAAQDRLTPAALPRPPARFGWQY